MIDLVEETRIDRHKNKKSEGGWRNIGRSLVTVVVGSNEIANVLSKDPDVVVIHFDEIPKNVHELRAFSPAVVDVVVIDTTMIQRQRAMKLAQSLRHRLLASVMVLDTDHAGEAIFHRWLGVVREAKSPWVRHLWMTISVAAQETWALSWIMMTRNTARTSLEAPALPAEGVLTPRPPSRTAPWSPTPEMLARLAEAYQD